MLTLHASAGWLKCVRFHTLQRLYVLLWMQGLLESRNLAFEFPNAAVGLEETR